jgi:hypothetical protein
MHAAPRLLEVDANTHLHGSWGSSLNGELPEIGGRTSIEEYGIQQLVVVQNVVDIERGFGIEAFCNFDVLLDSKIQVPVLEAAKRPVPTAAGIIPQDQRTNPAVHRRRISKGGVDSVEIVK